MPNNAQIIVEIINKKGLHARAAAKFVKAVTGFSADVTVTKLEPNGTLPQTVGGTSILGLMMLGADLGSKLQIAAQGLHANEALEALGALVQNRFGETE